MKKILAIDGGGVRGLIPALVLDAIEKTTGKKIAQMFDLVAGTSAGGILAVGFTKPGAAGAPQYSAAQLADLFAARGKDIFPRSFWKGVSSVGGMLDERYSAKPLEAILLQYFGDAVLGAALAPVLVSTYDIERRRPFFFKSWKPNRAPVKMRDVARATSAAPTYFEPAQVTVGGDTLALIDGGVFVNNPAVCAYAEGVQLWPDEKDFLIVSLGTGELTRPILYQDAKDWGKLEWAIPILGVVFDGVAKVVDYQLARILGPEKFFRFQTSLDKASDDLDNASPANVEALRAEAQEILTAQAADIGRLCPLL
jgi:uncharacterized protein